LLDPSPERTNAFSGARERNYSRPSKLLSKAKLHSAWQQSRDATTNAGRPGIDGVSAQQFSAKLDTNLKTLAKTLREGTYGPSRLKAVLIPKPNSEKFRLICIPTVRDRVVQRTIVEYLVKQRKFPIYNSSSYGFIKGRGTQSAIARAVFLRSKFDWCLKTDIEAFFDRIPRDYLKAQLANSLRASSLTPLISKIIDCEIKEDRLLKPRLLKQGVKPGVGVRQGMPLSPILANLVLASFDREVERASIEMIRYVDDILLFFATKAAAKNGHDLIKGKLRSLGLDIPELADNSKTELRGPQEPVDFLGREIVYRASASGYVSQVSRKQISKIKLLLEDEYSFQNRRKLGSNFQDTVVELWKSISSYRGIYKDAYNFVVLDSELRGAARKILSDIFKDVFGDAALAKITDDGRNFLGIGDLNVPPAFDDLDMQADL
jgi:RNA-directed DNA polymerase